MVRWTDRPGMTIAADWDVEHQTNLNKKSIISSTRIRSSVIHMTNLKFIT